jgi:hypothetical protein
MAGCFGGDPYDRYVEAELEKYLRGFDDSEEDEKPEDLCDDDELDEEE